uniref:Leucine rich repeat containing 69 n=1 Tax=Lates calcarifer TaxID=8187 RepID=A0A4W6CKB0_LATCA
YCLALLAELNLGNNALKEVPTVLGHLESLRKLYLFSNRITVVPPDVIGGLQNLVVLNLNHNQIQRLPPEIKRYIYGIVVSKILQHLSMMDNKLEEVPAELGHLTKLSEINLTSNKLSWLPQQLYQCKDLTKVHVARNKLTSLPELTFKHTLQNLTTFHVTQGIRALTKLQVVDVAGNKLSMFPVEFHLLSLKELYCEGNRFVHCEPMPSEQDAEVFSLKVIVMEVQQTQQDLLNHLLCKLSIIVYLSSGSCCALCLGPFLTTWLECVHFISLRKDMKMKSSLTIPVRALLCSYKCFNTDGHPYYGVATR